MADDNIYFRNEIEYLFSRSWPIKSLPNPTESDPDPLRTLLLAGITKFLELAYNDKISMGIPRASPNIIGDFGALAALPKILEERPEWALHMSPLPETFFLPDKDGNVLECDSKFASATYLAMNIIAKPPHYLFA